MKILVLGGTKFLGPHTVDAALARGHTVTLFNRGRTNTDLYPDLEKLRGDRDKGDLKSLEGRKWDAVIDDIGYVPRIVKESASLLAPNIGQYVFVSSVSVYGDASQPGIDESSPVGRLEDPTVEKITGETYGPLKALCEEAAEACMPGKTTVVRPGYIVGPLDPTDRFTYWPVRVSKGGEVLAPGGPDEPVQFIDGRDLGEFVIKLVEDGHAGVFNAVGPKGRLSMQEWLHGCKVVSGSDASFTWVPKEFLAEQKVGGGELPIYSWGEGIGFSTVKIEKALAHGMKLRPVGDTIRDTIAWAATRGEDYKWRAGIAPEKEAKVLAAWRER